MNEFDNFFNNKDFYSEFLLNKVICFKGNEYPFLFFSLLQNFLKQKKVNISCININDYDFLNLKAQLNQSFLGTSLLYWLGNLSDYKKKDETIAFLNSYVGPHSTCLFINDDKLISNLHYKVVSVPDFIFNIEQFSSLLFLWSNTKHNIILNFIKNVFEKVNKVSIDQICILSNYAVLLGNKNSIFIKLWLDKFLTSEQSLFTLSKYFFALDSESFFKCNNSVEKNYSSVFWTTYWSEQLFRAASFINLRNQSKNLQAKQIAYKLPFSFIQSDWKKVTFDELINAHQFITDIDHLLKNGASYINLELFYAKFFTKEFV